jgi:hypothetical protein
MERPCNYCETTMERQVRNTRPMAEVLYVCPRCGASTKRLTVHNTGMPESKQGFPEPPAVGEWTR